MAEQLPPEILARSDLLKLGAAAGLGFAALPLVQPSTSHRLARTPIPLALAPQPGVLDVYINEGYLKMVDDTLVYHRGFGSRPTDVDDPNPSLTMEPAVITAGGDVVASRSYPLDRPVPPRGTPTPVGPDPANPGQYFIRRNYWASIFPQRTVIAELGSTVRLRVQNRLNRPHTLTVYGAGPDGGDLTTGAIAPDSVAVLEFACPEPGTYIFADPTNAPVERVLGLFGVLVVMDPEHQWDIAVDRAT
ncbi:MAG: multicopper oxidase domain-containing protein, partial [Actinomycetes bacterium]